MTTVKLKIPAFSRPFFNSWGELFVNNKPMYLSRWPNKGMIRMGKIIDEGAIPRNNDFSNRGAIMEYDSLRISSWEFTDDMWISGYFKYGYADDALRIACLRIKKKRQSPPTDLLYTDSTPVIPGINGLLFNIKEETDEPGEYFLERTTGKLYFISPDSEIGSLHLSILEEPFFDIWKAENIHIKNITFEYSRSTILSLLRNRKCLYQWLYFQKLRRFRCNYRKRNQSVQKSILHEGNGKPIRGTVGSLQQHLYPIRLLTGKVDITTG